MAYLLIPSDSVTKTTQETHTAQRMVPIETTGENMAYNHNNTERSSGKEQSSECVRITYADMIKPYEAGVAVPTPLVWKKQPRTPAAAALPSRPTEAHIRHSHDYASSSRGAQAQQYRSSGGGVAPSSLGHNTRQPQPPQPPQARPLPPVPTPRAHYEQAPQAPATKLHRTPQTSTMYNRTNPPYPRPQTHPSKPPTRAYIPPPYAALCSPMTHNCDDFDDTVFIPFNTGSAVNLHAASRRASDAAHQNRVSLEPLEGRYLRTEFKWHNEYSMRWDHVKHVGRVVAEGVWKDR